MTIDDKSREVLKGLIARLDFDEYVARVQRGVEEMPEYRGFVEGRAQLDDRGAAGIRWNLETFLRWASAGGSPTAEEMERLRELVGARAAEGRPPEEGLAVYRRAMRAGWEAVLEEADEGERAALSSAFEIPLEWLDIVSRVFEQAYAEERDALVSRHERRARWLFERIVMESEPGLDDQRLADALGFQLAAGYRPLIVTLPGGSALRHLQLAELLREKGALAISEGTRVAGLAHAPLDEAWLGLGPGEESAFCESDPEERPALGEALADLRQIAAMAVAAGQRGRVDPDGRIAELLLARSPRLAARLDRRVFGPLLEAERADLVRTLELLAGNGFERAATAAELPVHRNTLVQRIARIEELTGLDLDDPGDRGLVWLATRAQGRRRAHD
jgi:hypothetical protein